MALALDRALDVASVEGLDRALYAATDAIEQQLERVFWPWHGTRTFDVPVDDTTTNTPSWRLWLAPHDLVTLDGVTVGGVAQTGAQARPDNRLNRPAEYLEFDRTGSSSFHAGAGGSQRRVAVAGLWGWWDESKTAGVLAAGLASGDGTVDLATAPVAGAAAVGVGHLIRVGDERMVVEDRLLADTGVDLADDLASAVASVPTAVSVPDGTDFAAGEILTIDGEALLVKRVLSNTLFVRRGYAGTPVQAHTAGADIYGYRRLQLHRAAAGTTEADHAGGAAVTRWQAPYAIEALCVAIAQETAVQEGAAYARTVGDGEMQRQASAAGLKGAWARARDYTRKRGRHYAV